jgi:small-conductance mechanosensitive channel/CRP-like cAMP-binding protein
MTGREILWVASAPVIYFLLLILGRVLKRRWGVRLGLFYQLFCIVTALFVPMSFLDVPGLMVRIFAAAVVLLATLFILALTQRGVWELHLGQKSAAPTPKFISEVFSLGIFLIVVLIVLKVFFPSIEIPHLIAGSGILAVIIGLAMQDTLSNILAGFALHFEKPYRVGDWLIVDNRHAQVTELNWRATRLRTNDDIYLDIPNNQLARATIVNLSYPTSVHAMRLRLGMNYSTPPNDVRDVLLRAVSHAAGVLKEPAAKVYVVEFGESAVIYEIKYWLSDHAHFNEINDALRTSIWYELHRSGMQIPFPIRTIHMESVGDGAAESRRAARRTLRQQKLFACFSDEHLDDLIATAKHSRYGRGEAIIEQGREGSSMFVLLDGSADVLVDANGHTTRVASLRPGDCFGEMSLLTGEPRSASVLARIDCEVIEIRKERLAEMLENSPELLQGLSEMLARRRLENEGALAESAQTRVKETQHAYQVTFLHRLKSFFEL